MSIPFKPKYALYVIPIKEVEREIKNWLMKERKIDMRFKISFEASESSFSKMGDVYFSIEEDDMTLDDLEKVEETYGNFYNMCIFKNILKDYFRTSRLTYDVAPFEEELHVRTDLKDYIETL